MDIKKIIEIKKRYEGADVFEQNEIAVEFMETHFQELIDNVLKCECEGGIAQRHKKKKWNSFKEKIMDDINWFEKENKYD